MAEKLSESTIYKETVTGKDEGDRAKSHRLSTRKKVGKKSRHRAALRQCPQKANCSRQATVKQSTPGMRKTGPSHTMSIIPLGMSYKLSQVPSHKETVTGKDEGDRAKPHYVYRPGTSIRQLHMNPVI